VSYPLSIVAVALVCLTTLVVGGLGLRLSRRTSDFYVAGRTVSPRLNASAISGEYLSAASFLGVAGLIYDRGVDMLWLPVGYTLGYLVLLVVVAAPRRDSGRAPSGSCRHSWSSASAGSTSCPSSRAPA
jgi:cation/acetate symporter